MSPRHHSLRHNARQLLAQRNPQLRLHQIDAGNHLRHRMLHLDARVHLDEVELAVFIHQKFDRPGILVANGLQRSLQRLRNVVAHTRRHHQRRRFFNQLLVPPLDRTLALAQRLRRPVLIGQHLKLNVPRPLDEFLHVQVAVAEGIRRFALRRLIQPRQLVRIPRHAHAASAAAG